MIANCEEIRELHKRIALLCPEDQMHLVEGVLANIRKSHLTDPEAEARETTEMIAEMVADMELEQARRGKDLPYGGKEYHEAG